MIVAFIFVSPELDDMEICFIVSKTVKHLAVPWLYL